jgi:D-glycerate 3-kinase
VDVTAPWKSLTLGGDSDCQPGPAAPAGVAAGDWRRLLAEVVVPLAAAVTRLGCRVVGVAGGAGAGKTTIARAAQHVLGPTALQVSLDDFYLPRFERLQRGLTWRAVPGSHDIALCSTVLGQFQARQVPVRLPAFDSASDDRAPHWRVVQEAPCVVFFDGWLLGWPGNGYAELQALLDLLVFVHVDVAVAKSRRVAREHQIRRTTDGGLSAAQMESFWQEVLGPGVEGWLAAARENSDVVISMDGRGRLASVLARDTRHGNALRDALRAGQ